MMGFLEGLVAKLIGKKLDADLTKWGISKTKVISWIGFIVAMIPKLSALAGHPVVVPPEILEALGALGLWTMRDGMDNLTATIQAPDPVTAPISVPPNPSTPIN